MTNVELLITGDEDGIVRDIVVRTRPSERASGIRLVERLLPALADEAGQKSLQAGEPGRG
jgi:hypothetical protein